MKAQEYGRQDCRLFFPEDSSTCSAKQQDDIDRTEARVMFRICHVGTEGCNLTANNRDQGRNIPGCVFGPAKLGKTDRMIFERNYGWCLYTGLKRTRTPLVGVL